MSFLRRRQNFWHLDPLEEEKKKLVGLDLLYFIRHGCWVNVRAFCPVFYEPLSDQQFLSMNMYTQRSPLSIMHCWELSQYHTLSPIYFGVLGRKGKNGRKESCGGTKKTVRNRLKPLNFLKTVKFWKHTLLPPRKGMLSTNLL